MHLCGFWLASGKKCQMTLGDSSLIWIQVISLESEVKVRQSCPTLGDCMGYTVHGILQARILEWVAFPFSSRSSRPRNRTRVFCIAGGFFLPAEPQGKPKNTEVGSLSFLQGIFPTQESNQGLLHCRRILYQLSYQRSLKGK